MALAKITLTKIVPKGPKIENIRTGSKPARCIY